MHRMFLAPFAILLQLNFAFNELFVLARVIIPPFANGALERDQILRTP